MRAVSENTKAVGGGVCELPVYEVAGLRSV